MTPFSNKTFPSEVVTFVSERSDDFSLTASQNDLTAEQKKSLSVQLNVNLTKAVNIRQVHGDKIIFVSKDDEYVPPEILEEADGILTDALNLPILIRIADCVPIFLYAANQKIIGLLHAGWKGTQKGILLKGLDQMHVRPENVKIAFGPAIRECCYEVGLDVQEYFPNEIIRREEKHYLDLVNVNVKQAMEFGVNEKNITDCKICTCCHNDYFSYRREGENAGRMLSLMMLRGGEYKNLIFE